jgi:hypothetical protein
MSPTISCARPHIAVAALMLALCVVWPSPGVCQTMSFSTYNDINADSDLTTLYGYGSVDDNSSGCSHYNFLTTASIYSPSNRSSSSAQGGYEATTSLSFDAEEGDWAVSDYTTYNCSCMMGGQLAIGMGLPVAVALTATYWQAPEEVYVGSIKFCRYWGLACSGGSPSCANGGVDLEWSTFCPTYARAVYAKFRFSDGSYKCSLGVMFSALGPGECS